MASSHRKEKVKQRPNQRGAGNGAVTLLFQVIRPRRACLTTIVSCMRAFLNIAVLLLLGGAACTRTSSPEHVFSDLSVGVPGYQTILSLTHPADAMNGDYFSMDLIQSSNQFGAFISKLGLAETNVLSAVGVSHVSVASKINPKYPWFLSLKAAAIEGRERLYRVHIEGQQPYD